MIFFYASFSSVTSPKEMDTAEEPPPLPIHTLPSCLFNPSALINNFSCIYSFSFSFHLTTVPSSPPKLLNFTQIHFLHSSFSLYGQTTSTYFFSPIPLHHTSLPLRKVSCYIFHTHFHCSHLPPCHTICTSQITHFHSTHSSLLCLIP